MDDDGHIVIPPRPLSRIPRSSVSITTGLAGRDNSPERAVAVYKNADNVATTVISRGFGVVEIRFYVEYLARDVESHRRW